MRISWCRLCRSLNPAKQAVDTLDRWQAFQQVEATPRSEQEAAQAGPSGPSSYPITSSPSPSLQDSHRSPFGKDSAASAPAEEANGEDGTSADESASSSHWREDGEHIDPTSFPRIIAAEAHSRPEEDWYAATVFIDLVAFAYTVVRYQVKHLQEILAAS